MKRAFIYTTVAAVASTAFFGFSPQNPDKTVALAIKVVQDVSRKTQKVDWAKARKGDRLYSGDFVRTGDRSIAIVKFTDNSMLRVREKSELKVLGDAKDGILSKTVAIERGEFSFDIPKQQKEKFTFTSPTSVASIRGTQGNMQSDQAGDLLTVTNGLVSLLNTVSNKSVDVGAGQTGLSRRDGSIEVREASAQETSHTQSSIDAARDTGVEKLLELELEDTQGNRKLVRIRYRD